MHRPLLLLAIVALTACVPTAQQQVHNHYQVRANAERTAWQRAQTQSDEKCGKYDDSNPLPRDKAIEVGNCYVEIVRQLVIPVANNPHAVNTYLLDLQTINIEYKKGQVDRDEAKLKAQKAWHNYSGTVDSQYQSSMQQAYQVDVEAAKQRQKALQDLSKQQQQNDTFKNTNCTIMGNTMNCTEY